MAQKRAVIYCRVSTKEQAEEGNSLLTQERLCNEYATKHEFEIVKKYIEEGESAKTADRTELKKLLLFCANKKNNIEALLVYKLDRLSRNTDDYSQLRILLKRYGVEIKSTSEHFENTPAGRFMENIIANVAQFDNDVRTERSVGGMREAIREGRYVWKAPVGYSNVHVEGKATIAPNETAALIKQAFEMAATNRHSVKELYETFHEIGLKTKNGKSLTISHFYKALKNELYAGWIIKFGERHKGNFKPIVDEELFARVQRILRGRSHKGFTYRVENPDFPLRRFVMHSSGKKLTGSWCQGNTKKYAYYRFLGAVGHDIRKEVLEDAFATFMNSFRFKDDLFFKLKTFAEEEFETCTKISQGHTNALKDKLPKLKEKQDTLIQKNLDGVISDSLLRTQLEKVESEIFTIENTLIDTNRETQNLQGLCDLIREFLQSPGQVWIKSPFVSKKKLQWFQFPQGVIFDGNEFRTPISSCLFKAKESFLTDFFPKVHLRNKITNPPYLANFLKGAAISTDPGTSAPVIDVEFWQKVRNDIVTLSEIIKDCGKEDKPDELSFLTQGPQTIPDG